jgi:hypothetical protein
MGRGLLGGLSDYLFGSVDNSQYLQAFAQQQQAAEQARLREQQAYAAQQQYQQYIQSVINGTAPSMAQMQLMQGLGAQQQAQQSMAAGLGGPGNALARYGAAVNYGNAAAGLQQQQALARVAEQGQARNLYGQNAQAMQQGSAGMYGNIANNALGYGNLAAGIDKFNVQQEFLGAGSLLQGAGQAGASYLSGGSPKPQDTSRPDASQYNANNPYPV